jgi:hypothetical protein
MSALALGPAAGARDAVLALRLGGRAARGAAPPHAPLSRRPKNNALGFRGGLTYDWEVPGSGGLQEENPQEQHLVGLLGSQGQRVCSPHLG